MIVLFVMDPIETVDPHHDSTVALIRASQARGQNCFYCRVENLEMDADTPMVWAKKITIQENTHQLEAPQRMTLARFDLIWMRKDPPVNLRYLNACQILQTAAAETRVINSPSALAMVNEKLSILQFTDLIPETMVASDPQSIRPFAESLGGKVVLKPLNGFGGQDIFALSAQDPNFSVAAEVVTRQSAAMVQRFVPESQTSGDKRILWANGKPLGAILRVPGKQDHRGNMAKGATATLSPVSGTDQKILDRISPFLLSQGIVFAGVDVLGDRLTEINITSPTGLQELDRLGQHSFTDDLIQSIESLIN